MGYQVGLGFIGCGKHAYRSHAQLAVKLSDLFRIYSVYDPSEEAMQKFCELQPGVNKTKSADEVLADPAVQAVIIATPPQFHMDLMEKAISAGKHVLCEKPLWIDGADDTRGIGIIKKAQDKGLVLTSCHPRRFEPLWQGLARQIPDLVVELGAVREVNYRFFYHVPPEGWRQGDSLLLDHLNHEVDVVRFLLGPEGTDLVRLNDGPAHYAVRGWRWGATQVTLNFSGYRTLQEKLYRN